MPTRLDYADWLTPERLLVEEVAWAKSAEYVEYAAALDRVRALDPDVKVIAELGCGTGWVPGALSKDLQPIQYIGIDKNPHCLNIARRKNRMHTWALFEQHELRDIAPAFDVVCAFAVLKHFNLDEWDALFKRWFTACDWAVFTVPLAKVSTEDGTEFTHTWRTMADVTALLNGMNKRVVWQSTHNAVEPIIIATVAV